MARGPKKHMKRLAAPRHWMLDKLGGVYAPRPSPGPHKLRESLPLIILIRNRLKYALTRREANMIVLQRLVKVDGKVRTDARYPAGFMDVVSIEKTNEFFRLLYDVKGRYVTHRITPEEAKSSSTTHRRILVSFPPRYDLFKLCSVRAVSVGPRSVPFIVTHDGRTIRYPDPDVKVHDTVKVDIDTGKIVDHIKFDHDQLCMVIRGKNAGRVGLIVNRERHLGSFDIVHVKDASGHAFATRLDNVFVIGKGNKPSISLPKGKGLKLSIIEETAQRTEKAAK
eukprot:tig00021433_g21290.t1